MSESARATRTLDGNAVAVLISLALPVASEAPSYESLKRSLKAAVAKDPFDATIVTVLGGAFLFYVAEKGNNPKVESYWDALLFISTCLSVGYADVFARTPAGKAIAAAVMTFGPAMSGALLDGPGEPLRATDESRGSRELAALQRVIVEKLDAVIDALRADR